MSDKSKLWILGLLAVLILDVLPIVWMYQRENTPRPPPPPIEPVQRLIEQPTPTPIPAAKIPSVQHITVDGKCFLWFESDNGVYVVPC